MAEKTIESPHKPRLGRTERRLLVAFAIVLLLLLGYAGYRWALARAVDAELDRIRAAGYPATTAELEEWIGEPDDNLAPDVLALARRIVQPAGAEEDLVPILGAAEAPPPGQPWPPEMRQAVAEVLKRNQTVIDQLQALDWSRDARYAGDLSKGYAGLEAAINNYSPLRSVANALCLRAEFVARGGHTDEATTCFITAMELVRSVGREPLFAGLVAHISCEAITLNTIERVMSLASFKETELASLAEVLTATEISVGPRKALISDRAVTSDHFREQEYDQIVRIVSTRPGGGVSGKILGLAYFALGLKQLDHLAYLRYGREMIETTRQPVREWLDRAWTLNDRLNDTGLLRLGMPRLEGGYASDRVLELLLQSKAMRRAAYGAVAVERYRLRHGELPEALDDCVPAFLDAVPLDPHTGDPIRYQVEPDRFTVYTVGEDKTDDGGVDEGNPPAGSEHYGPGTDITFTVRLERSTGGEAATSP